MCDSIALRGGGGGVDRRGLIDTSLINASMIDCRQSKCVSVLWTVCLSGSRSAVLLRLSLVARGSNSSSTSGRASENRSIDRPIFHRQYVVSLLLLLLQSASTDQTPQSHWWCSCCRCWSIHCCCCCCCYLSIAVADANDSELWRILNRRVLCTGDRLIDCRCRLVSPTSNAKRIGVPPLLRTESVTLCF